MNNANDMLWGALQNIFPSALLFLIFGILIAILKSFLNSAKFKGRVGENTISRANKKLLLVATNELTLSHDEPSSQLECYSALDNLILPTITGTTQIDHVLVSIYGVFVIETKNMSGWIFGDADSTKWIQSIYGNKRQFQNPLRQNYKHTQAIKAVTGLTDEQIHSIVVFVGDCELKTQMPTNVLQGKLSYVNYIKSHHQQLLSDMQVIETLNLLSGYRAINRKQEQAHVVQLNHQRTKQTKPLCPNCQNDMILRTAKKGSRAGQQFWGCSYFPNCRGSRPITPDK